MKFEANEFAHLVTGGEVDTSRSLWTKAWRGIEKVGEARR